MKRKKFRVGVRGGVALYVQIEEGSEFMVFLSLSVYLRSFFFEDEGLQEDVKIIKKKSSWQVCRLRCKDGAV